MIEDLQNRVVERLERLKVDIQAAMAAKRINASGRTSRSLQVEMDDEGARLVAKAGNRAPLETLEIGRPGGGVPGGFRTTKSGVRDVSNTFKYILIKWAEEKGFELNWGGATMLGRRIAEKGTLRNQQPIDVYSTLTKTAAEEIKEMMLGEIKQIIKLNF